MEHTPSVDEMISVVQAYIKERKGKSVRIVLNNPMCIRKHMVMLNEAYNIAIANNENTK